MPLEILVVDDSQDILFYLNTLLKENGYGVKLADNGVKALEFLKKVHFDVMITDFNMPGTDGFQLLRALQQDPDLSKIAVIVLTGRHLDPSTRNMVESESNVRKVFLKPIDNAVLLKAIKELGTPDDREVPPSD